MKKRVTLQDIADKLNISKVSVSKAINNQPGISEDLRKKILSLAYESGYIKTNANHHIRSNNFAFIVQQKFFIRNENFYTVIYYHLNELCTADGKNLLLFVVNPDDTENGVFTQLNKNTVDGFFIGGEINESYLHMLNNMGIPMVFIDFFNPHVNKDCVLIDNFNISFYVTSYLFYKGHRKIGFVGNQFSTANVLDRFYGYRKALNTYNLEYREEWLLNNYNQETGLHTLDIELPKEMPTAFVCHCDMSAYFFIQKLNSLNIRVPEDVSIISFDNTMLAQSCTPPLTSVDINKKEFASMAYDLLNNRIRHPQNEVRRTYLNTKIYERESVKSII
ncbi:MAG TPA: LacI family transcriptional regulator [Clostridiales bacterium]|nr:LacI family transcriptional regulator [Clostridiales bacterium]